MIGAAAAVQIYAAPPADTHEDHPGAFHRALFVFVSPTASGLKQPGGARVLRSQLPRCNPYYASEPSSEAAPPRCSDAVVKVSAQRDAWQVLRQEQTYGTSALQPCASGTLVEPPLLKELALAVEAAVDTSQVRACSVLLMLCSSWPGMPCAALMPTGLREQESHSLVSHHQCAHKQFERPHNQIIGEQPEAATQLEPDCQDTR